jgi:hypothetical protein
MAGKRRLGDARTLAFIAVVRERMPGPDPCNAYSAIRFVCPTQ